MSLRAGVRTLAVAASLLTCSASAQSPAVYPAKPVRVIVGLAPGGATDIQARMFAQKLTEHLGRSFIVENRTGAGGTIAYAQVAKAAPDGYTLLAAAGGYSSTPAIYAKLAYDPVKDFAPISLVAQAPFLLLVHPSVPATSIKDLLALARARPGTLDFASAGHGTSTGLALELFRSMAKVNVTHVPYKGTGQALFDTVAGQVQALFANILSGLPYVKSGRLRALGVTGAARSFVLPALPTIAEAGVPGYETTTWHGWLAPAGTPAPVIGRLNAELIRVARAPDVKERLAADGAEPVGGTPEQFAQQLIAEITRWRNVVGAAGIKLNEENP